MVEKWLKKTYDKDNCSSHFELTRIEDGWIISNDLQDIVICEVEIKEVYDKSFIWYNFILQLNHIIAYS